MTIEENEIVAERIDRHHQRVTANSTGGNRQNSLSPCALDQKSVNRLNPAPMYNAVLSGPDGKVGVTSDLSQRKDALSRDIEQFRMGKMTMSMLRKRWPKEHNSHRGMLDRRKTRGAKVADEFLRFDCFLAEVGPCPGEGFTLDRIDCFDPEYSPDKVRWASKTTQSNNRSNTRLIQFNGAQVPLSEVARCVGVKPDTLRKRVSRGRGPFISSTIRQQSKSSRWREMHTIDDAIVGFVRMSRSQLLDFEPWRLLNLKPETLANMEQWFARSRKPGESRLDFAARFFSDAVKHIRFNLYGLSPEKLAIELARLDRGNAIVRNVLELQRFWNLRMNEIRVLEEANRGPRWPHG